MNFRKGDNVKILSGKDRGKSGKVLRVNTKSSGITVEGLNIAIRHRRPRKQGEKGQKVQIPAPLDSSVLMLICPNCSKTTRVSYTLEDGKKFRVCKKCGKKI